VGQTNVVCSKSTDWGAHYGHRLGVEVARVPEDRPGAGLAIVCLHCDVTLAYRPAEGGGEPRPEEKLDPLLEEVIGIAAGMRLYLLDTSRSAARPTRDFCVPGHPALSVKMPADPERPYWDGYHDGHQRGQEFLASHLCRLLEDAACRHAPAPDRRTAGRFVWASVLARLAELRPTSQRAAPGAARSDPPPSGSPFFVSGGH
jgi:hypothetical protein